MEAIDAQEESLTVKIKNEMRTKSLIRKSLIMDHPVSAWLALKCRVFKETISVSNKFYALFLDGDNRVIRYCLISSSNIHSNYIDMKLLLTLALKYSPVKVIISRNILSEHLEPSNMDLIREREIKIMLKLINITLLDYLLINADDYYSFFKKNVWEAQIYQWF